MVDSKNLGSIREYLATHKQAIINEYQAEGVGIGKVNPKDDAYAIVVYVMKETLVPEQPIIKDGIPLKFDVTGSFTLHQ
ncbi:MAG TPA: hypothetical protein DDY37_07540 [Legionella sp.]|nr:hypothetical protein [Legionella sp.]